MVNIVLATNNPHKRTKLCWIVKPFFNIITAPREEIDVVESGNSFKQNAELKAFEVAKRLNNYAIATDGGVLIPALGKNWNALLTRRFTGNKNTSDIDRMETLLALMQKKKGEERKVIWKEALAIASPSGILFSTEVTGDTGILQNTYNPKQYRKGIWLCTLTRYPQFDNKNFFELNESELKYSERSWWKLRKRTHVFLGKQDFWRK